MVRRRRDAATWPDVGDVGRSQPPGWPRTPPVGQHRRMETTRVDRFVWAVRLYPTRSAATAACQGGHVEVNGRGAKPATPIRVGDRIEATVGGRLRVLEVRTVIEKRVGPPLPPTASSTTALPRRPALTTRHRSPASAARGDRPSATAASSIGSGNADRRRDRRPGGQGSWTTSDS